MGRISTDQVELARDRDLLELARGYGVHLKRIGAGEVAGPCPACRAGRDRFSINVNKRVFNCRKCGIKGKNAIDLVMQIDGCAFADAVTKLTGGACAPAHARETAAPRIR